MGICARLLVGILLVGCAHHHPGGNGGDLDGGGVTDACTDLSCFQVDCSTKVDAMGNPLPPTSVSGIVYAPNGTLPLYGVNVYVPLMDPGPLMPGVQCDNCAQGLQGGALVQIQTDEAGHFSLPNMPATANVPLVIQSGKWRRELTLPGVAACQDQPIDVADTTLPKAIDDMTPNTTHVDMPQVAITTGNADAIECLVLKLGVAPKEITPSTGTGHVHLYADTSSPGVGATQFEAGWPGGSGAAFTDSQALWNSLPNLSLYDIVMFSCEGDQYPATKTQQAMQNVHDYAGIGGRVFMSHWHNIWIAGENGNPSHGLADWESIATFNLNAANPDPDSLTATIDEVSNPKGMSFATWMQNVITPTPPRDLVPITGARDTCTAFDSTKAERWVYLDPATSPGVSSVQDMLFTTPNDQPEAQRCGKVVFSDMHVSSNSTSPAGAPGYPSGCSMAPLTPQEKALAFIFFDISSCVGSIF